MTDVIYACDFRRLIRIMYLVFCSHGKVWTGGVVLEKLCYMKMSMYLSRLAVPRLFTSAIYGLTVTFAFATGLSSGGSEKKVILPAGPAK